MNNQALNDFTWFKASCNNEKLVAACAPIKLIICDVDGTLTNAGVYTTAEKEGGRFFSTQDGFLVKHALNQGLTIALVSGKSHASTFVRAEQLGIPRELCIGGTHDKPTITRELQKKLGITPDQTIAFGDDYLDAKIKIDGAASCYACPENTMFYLQPMADLIIPAPGGTRALRLLLDFLLYINNKHLAQDLIKLILPSEKNF